MKNNKKGFTLAEMLIVVAIISVLVAIVTPVLTKNLEKSREAADAANIRAAISEVTANFLAGDYTDSDPSNLTKKVTITQTAAGWGADYTKIGGIDTSTINDVIKDDVVKVTIDTAGNVTFAKEE